MKDPRPELKEQLDTGETVLPNGSTLAWRRNDAGGRTYTTDEVGVPVLIFDSAINDPISILAAMVKEQELSVYETFLSRQQPKIEIPDKKIILESK